MPERLSQDADPTAEGLAAQAEAEGYELEPFISEAQIAQRVAELGIAVTHECGSRLGPGQPLVLVIVLKGALTFATDLARAMDCHTDFRLVRVTTYKGTQPARPPRVESFDPPESIRGQHVLIVEDIVDTGATINALREWATAQEPASLTTCTLLVREHLADAETPPVGHWGFDIPEGLFLVGYGLDLDERFRNLPYLAAIERP